MTVERIICALHRLSPGTRRLLAGMVAATVLAVAATGATLAPTSSKAAPNRDDWPACGLFTGLAGTKLRAQGHRLRYERIGQRGGFYWLNGTFLGKTSEEQAPFLACADERTIKLLRAVPKY